MTNTKSRINFAFLGLAALTAGCASTRTAVPAGYANGVKTVDTPNLIFSSSGNGLLLDSAENPTGTGAVQVTYQETSDPDVVIATVSGQEFKLTWDGAKGLFYGTSADGSAEMALLPYTAGYSADSQVSMGYAYIGFADGTHGATYYAAGLKTDPVQMAALTGTATYAGYANLAIGHGTSNVSFGDGSLALAADFGAGTVSGSMTVSDSGSDPGFTIAPNTVITIDPATISGNGFNGTWSVANPANLALTSVGTTGLQGSFYGVNAADVGGSFNGTGVSADGVTPAYIFGGFMGQ